MAAIASGNVSTEEVLPDERKIDMDEEFKKLRPDETQFSTMTDRLGSKPAIREKVNWIEQDLFPRVVQPNAAGLVGDTSIVLKPGNGLYVAKNDMLRNMATSEMMKITNVATDTLTVLRGQGAIGASAIGATDKFLVVADAQPQGSDFPAARYAQRTLGFNYTQITRTTWQFTRTATEISLYGGNEPAKEAKRKAVEHKRKWEAIGFFGARTYDSVGVTPEFEPQGTAGGMLEFITAGAVLDQAGAALKPVAFDTWLMKIYPYGTTDKVLFCSPLVALNMAQWNRSGMGAQWAPTPENIHGVHVDAFISGAYGYRLPVVVKKEWAEFGTTGFGALAVLVDMGNVQQRPLHSTSLYTNQQPIGKDSYAAGYLTESTYEIAIPAAHGKIVNVGTPVDP